MSPAGNDPGWAVVEWAFHHPDEVAEEWRRGGGKVVGVVGADVPVEVLSAAGLLAIRLAPSRLPIPSGNGPDDEADLAPELPPPARRILSAWRTGALSWIDALIVGRDRETDSLLFAVLRELEQCGAVTGMPRVAGHDVLRLRTRAANDYNLRRGLQLLDLAATWSGHYPSASELEAAISAYNEVAARLAATASIRTDHPGGMSGSRALMLAAASATLPLDDLSATLDAITTNEAADPSPNPARRVWLSGSGIEDPGVYEHLEHAGLVVAGEDHEWAPPEAAQPLSGGGHTAADSDIVTLVAAAVDRRAGSLQGSARMGLAERVAHVVQAASLADACAVVQVTYDHDPAPRWERPALAAALAQHGLSLWPVRLDWESKDLTALDAVASKLSAGCDVGA